MSVLGSLQPAPIPFYLGAIATGNEVLVWRASGPCQVDSGYMTSDVTIVDATDTVRVEVGKKAAGTGAFAQIVDFPAATVKTADTPVTGTMTATTANTKLVDGDWVAVKPTLAGTGVLTRWSLILNIIAGHKN